jgi:pilus assembly protein CpaF
MLQAMNTGHDGSLSTVHANSPRDALARVETMVLMAGFDLPVRAIRQQVCSALDLIVHLERLEDGTRRVTRITEVQRMEADVVTLQELFKFNFNDKTSDGKIVGGLCSTGMRPESIHKFEKRGITLPLSMFQPGVMEGNGAGERPTL